jgi:hypothetical protein
MKQKEKIIKLQFVIYNLSLHALRIQYDRIIKLTIKGNK